MQLGSRIRSQKSYVPLFQAVNSNLLRSERITLAKPFSPLERYVCVNFCTFLLVVLTEFRRRLASDFIQSIAFVFGSKGH